MSIISVSITFKLWLFTFSTACFAAEVTKLTNLKGDAVFTPLKDSRTNACVTDTSAYVCDFSSPCQFGGTSDSQWYQMDGYPDYQTWTDSVGTPTSSTPPSLAVQLGGDVPFGILQSDPIPCASSGSSLIFKFWSTKNVMLQTCLISQSGNKEIVCSEQLNQQSPSYPGSFTIDIPNGVNEPFMIQFMASSEPGVEGFLILDDVYYYGSLCDSPPTCNGGEVVTTQSIPTTQNIPTTKIIASSTTTTSISTKLVPSTTPIFSTKSISTTKPIVSTSKTTTTIATTTSTKKPAQQPNVCQAVPCNFENGWCKFSNFLNGSVAFERRNSPYGPPLYRMFDIKMTPTTGYYISAMINGKTDIAVVSSSQFEPSNNKQLSFKFYRAVDGHTIKICFDTNLIKYSDKNSMKQCANAIPKLTGANALNWNTATISIPNTATKFHVVATNDGTSGGSGPVAIDDISVVGC